MFVHGGRDLGNQRAGVADAGHAAVADEIEPDRVQVVSEPGPGVVVGYHLGAGRQRCLDPGFPGHSPLDGLLRHQGRAQHHGRIGGVGAGCDGCDGDGSVPQLEGRAVGEGYRHRGVGGVRVGGQHLAEAVAGTGEQDPVLGTFRPGDGRHHGSEVEFDVLGVVGFAIVQMPQPLGLGVGLHQGDLGLVAPGQAQVVDGFPVDREHRDR